MVHRIAFKNPQLLDTDKGRCISKYFGVALQMYTDLFMLLFYHSHISLTTLFCWVSITQRKSIKTILISKYLLEARDIFI